MSRILKFRAWDENENKYNFKVLPGNLDSKDENYTAGIIWYNDKWVNFTENCKIIVEQFTGLLDKNGKEIYEGDNVLWHDKKWEIKWHEMSACFVLSSPYPTFDFDGMNTEVAVEIIGNIHESVKE